MLNSASSRIGFALFSTALFLAGCFAPVHIDKNIWFVAGKMQEPVSLRPKYDAYAKLTSLTVRSPFDNTNLAVLRRDGTIAFDAYNAFASSPTVMLKFAAVDALNSAALFKGVYGSGSSVRAAYDVEMEEFRFALDCTSRREAVVEVGIVLLNGRAPERVSLGKSSVDASDGNYSAAFTEAFFAAVKSAAAGL